MTEPIQLESPQALINRARFASKDFFTFVDDLLARIQANFVTAFNDFISSDVGLMLIDVVSWASESISFYIDRQAAESYLETARTRRAVNRLARQLGYKMVPAVAASVDLEINLKRVWPFDVVIPIGFQFQGPNDLIFEAVEAVTFPAGEGPTSPSRTVSCREGVTVIESFRSDGTRNQRFALSPGSGKYVAQDTVSVTVAAATWLESEFITYDQTDQYEVDFNNEPPLLRFGDGVAGNIPVTGADIVAEYIATTGQGGLVTSGTIEDVVSPLVVMFQTIPLTITNPEPSSGGANREELTETKRRVPFFFKARGVAVTQEDYIGLSQAYSDPTAGTVAVAQAFVALGAEDDLTLATLLDNIRVITNALATSVTAETASIEASRATIETARDDAESANSDVGTALGTIATASAAARVGVTDSKSEIVTLEGEAAALSAFVAGLPSAAPSQLDTSERTSINNLITSIQTQASAAKGDANTALGELTNVDNAQADASTAQGDVATELTAMVAPLAQIATDVADIDALMSSSFETAIETELQAIYDHVDGFLSTSCQANLVQVPIATKDVDGFLVAPSAALVRSLNSYLNARKEVTQVVEVISGGPFLVAADILGTIGVLEGYVQATVLSQVRAAVDDLLRDRVFGESLRLSDIYTSIAPDPLKGTGGVVGVKYAVFEIVGPAGKIDPDGNLIILTSEVITKGTVTISGETAS